MLRIWTAVATLAVGLTSTAIAQDKGTLKVGGLATLEGAFTVLGEDSMRGIEVALEEAGYSAGRLCHRADQSLIGCQPR